MALRPLSLLFVIPPLLALAACQSVGAGAGSLSPAETATASQVGLTAAAADRCAVPYNAKRMLDTLLARSTDARQHNDTLAVYDEVFEGLRRKFAADTGFCSPERLAQTRKDVARYGG
jgi:hypothetical protein